MSSRRSSSRSTRSFGPQLDVLVNVVGGTFRQPFADSVPKGWEVLIRTNFTWMLQATSLAIPGSAPRRGGSIINLTSIEAHRATPGHTVYAAMKSAMHQHLTRTLAVELGPDGIRVNSIAPKIVPTEAMGAIGGEAATRHDQAARLALLLGRVGTYADIGGCALFLASDLSVVRHRHHVAPRRRRTRREPGGSTGPARAGRPLPPRTCWKGSRDWGDRGRCAVRGTRAVRSGVGLGVWRREGRPEPEDPRRLAERLGFTGEPVPETAKA